MNLKQMRAAALKAAQDIAEAAKAAGRELSDDEQTQIEAHLDEVKSLDEKIEKAAKSADLVSRLQSIKEPEPLEEPDAGRKAQPSSIGERFVQSGAFKAFREGNPSGVGSGTPIRIEAKGVGSFEDLVGRKATITTSTGQIAQNREPGYRSELVDQRLTFLDLITTGTTNVAYSEYAQIVSETNNAAIVAEGDLKPLSDVTTDKQESKAYTYADGFDITNQTLADDGALAAYLETRIRRHVLGVVEQKAFNGSGTGTEPAGIMTTSGTLSQAFDTDILTTLARAFEKFETSNPDIDPQAIVMSAADAWKLRLLRENGATGAYMLGNPLQQGLTPTPFGVPLVTSSKLSAGTALVGRFDSFNFLTLEALNVLAFNQHKDYAQRNMVYVRAELRGRQLFYAPREVVVATIKAA